MAYAARAAQLALLTAQFLQRFCGWAVGIGAKDDHMLSTRMGNAEPVAMKVQLTDDRVPHMRESRAVTDLGSGPQLAES